MATVGWKLFNNSGNNNDDNRDDDNNNDNDNKNKVLRPRLSLISMEDTFVVFIPGTESILEFKLLLGEINFVLSATWLYQIHWLGPYFDHNEYQNHHLGYN